MNSGYSALYCVIQLLSYTGRLKALTGNKAQGLKRTKHLSNEYTGNTS